MARTKGAVNTSTMLKVIREAGRYREGLEGEPRDRIKAVYETALANGVPNAKAVPAPGIPQKSAVDLGGNDLARTQSPAVQPANPAAAPVESEWARKARAAVKDAREKHERRASEARAWVKPTPPCPRDTLNDQTVLEDRTLAEWKEIEEKTRETEWAAQKAQGKTTFTYVCGLPGWVQWALRYWAEDGYPTVKGEAQANVERLLAKAETETKDSIKDEAAASQHEKDGERKPAQKRRESAVRRRAKAEAFRKEAEEIAAAHNIPLRK